MEVATTPANVKTYCTESVVMFKRFERIVIDSNRAFEHTDIISRYDPANYKECTVAMFYVYLS